MVYTVHAQQGQKIRCPQCTSTQTKALTMQTRKYPEPELHQGENRKSLGYWQRIVIWKKSFSCQRCGTVFLVLQPGESEQSLLDLAQHMSDQVKIKPAPRVARVAFLTLAVIIALLYFFAWIGSSHPRGAVTKTDSSPITNV